MEPHLPEFSRIHVISDLHMGGRGRDFQIFDQGSRLATFIDSISDAAGEGRQALILNGDTFDSLAEGLASRYASLRVDEAALMMERLYRDPSFKPVWDSLGSYVRKAHNHLVFVIGNHDIEVALPVVERSIQSELGRDDEQAKGRVHFACHGGGYSCRVAWARVFCTHGNELDPWNWVDYNLLGQLANAMNAGRDIDLKQWRPNAGTRLVIDVMNEIKREHAFVDLMKPLVASVAGVAVALDKGLFRKVDLSDVWPLLKGNVEGILVTRRLLGQEGEAPPVSQDELARAMTKDLLGKRFRRAVDEVAGGRVTSEDILLLEAEENLAENRTAKPDFEEGLPETLSAMDIIAGFIGWVSKEEGLRLALLDWLDEDHSNDLEYKDATYKAMQQRIGEGVHFVVTGHTHEARALPCESVGCFYYNSGSWIRKLQLTHEVLKDKDAFESLWKRMKTGTLATLDGERIPGPDGTTVRLIQHPTYAVRIAREGDEVVGQLLLAGVGSSTQTVQKSRFRVARNGSVIS